MLLKGELINLEQVLNILLFVLGGIQFVDIVISFYLYKTNDNSEMYLFLFIQWIAMASFFLSDFLLGPISLIHTYLSYPFALISSLCFAKIVSILYKIHFDFSIHFKRLLIAVFFVAIIHQLKIIESFFALGIILWFVGCIPLIKTLLLAHGNTVENKKWYSVDHVFIFTLAIWCLHFFDYPLLRPLENFQFSIFGFSFALVLTYVTSVLSPVVINRHINHSINDFLSDKLKLKSQELDRAHSKMVTQEKLASLVTITSGVAHEIRNPLNVVNMSEAFIQKFFSKYQLLPELEILSQSRDGYEYIIDDYLKLQQSLKMLNNSCTRLDYVVTFMLSMTRGDNTVKETINLSEIVKENYMFVLKSHESDFISKVLFETELDECPTILGNKNDFNRLCINLLDNALFSLEAKYHGMEDFRPLIKVTCRKDTNYLMIDFYDNGMGMSEETQTRILEPFYTTKLGTKGTGLGMSLVNEIVSDYQGNIQIESKLGEFAQIRIRIPLGSVKL